VLPTAGQKLPRYWRYIRNFSAYFKTFSPKNKERGEVILLLFLLLCALLASYRVKFNLISKYIFISVGNLFMKHWGNTMNDDKGASHTSFVGEMVNLGIIFVGTPEGNGEPR
jgi:hypothetical protein